MPAYWKLIKDSLHSDIRSLLVKHQRTMGLRDIFILPGHKYLGPGNYTNNGIPVDFDDLIAQQHDIAYENAVDTEDVHIADKKAIFAFIIDWIKNKNWHSAIGAMGLGMKHLVEVICGTIFYPKLRKKI